MSKLLIIAQRTGEMKELASILTRNGFTCKINPHNNGWAREITTHRPDIIMVEMGGDSAGVAMQELSLFSGREGSPPIMALIPEGRLADIENNLVIDDFITGQYDIPEMTLRIRRLLSRTVRKRSSNRLIECDGLVIDQDRCEVTVDGRIVELTYLEYELLCFLASNRGRVYTREALLDRVWGYDYFGGDRTVDVHIRRLRSKIEDATHTFIETLRNIGYRFKKNRN